MPQSSIQTVFLTVHLGNAPIFNVKASPSPTATSGACVFTGNGNAGDDKLLLQLLKKLANAYGQLPSTTITIDNANRIIEDP
jgi:hypothetical protein